MSAPRLPDRIAALRESLVPTVASDDEREPPGAEMFDTILWLLTNPGRSPDERDEVVRAALGRRLAWGEPERRILADAAAMGGQVVRRACPLDPGEAATLAVAVAEAGATIARVTIRTVAGRVARERAAHVREDLAHQRLAEALKRQRAEIALLEGSAPGPERPDP